MHPLFHPVRVLCRIIVVCTQMFRWIATPSDTNGSLQGAVCGAWQMSAASRRSGRLRRPRLIHSLHARSHQTSRTRCWEIAAQIRCKRRRISGGKLAHRTACRFGGRAKQRACRRIQDGDIRTGTAHVLVPACVSERQGTRSQSRAHSDRFIPNMQQSTKWHDMICRTRVYPTLCQK